jgi:hypothetical protein
LEKQPADLHSLETALFWAREVAEELGEVLVLYFIDMAIAEAKTKSPPSVRRTLTKHRLPPKPGTVVQDRPKRLMSCA